MAGEGLAGRAARIVAAHAALRRLPPYAPGYGAPLQRFLDEWVTEAQPKGGLHVHLAPDRPGGAALLTLHDSMLRGDYGDDYARLTDYMLRPPPTGGDIHLYVELSGGKPYAGIHGPVDEDAKPWTHGTLRARVLGGDHGWLDKVDVWRNPYIIGRLRSLVWSGNPRLWRHCGGKDAEAARLAWEALSGSEPWVWRFTQRDTEPYWLGQGKDAHRNPASTLSSTRRRTLRRVAEVAGRLYPRYRALPTEVPLAILRDRHKTDTGLLEALAFYLIEHRDGPGIPRSRAAGLLGCKDHTSLRHAVDGYLRKHPKAPKWPGPHRDWGPRIKVGEDATMSHH